jgi:hypothetical protein
MAAAEPDARFVIADSWATAPTRGHRGTGGATALSQAVSGDARSDIARSLLGACRTETVRALKTHDPDPDLHGSNALWWATFHGWHTRSCSRIPGLARSEFLHT